MIVTAYSSHLKSPKNRFFYFNSEEPSHKYNCVNGLKPAELLKKKKQKHY